MENLTIKDGEEVESVWVEIMDRRKNQIKIGGVYGPPEGCTVGGVPKTAAESKGVEGKLLNEIKNATRRGSSIIVGDFN